MLQGAAAATCAANVTKGLGLGAGIFHTASGADAAAASWEACCTACGADTACTSWTWIGTDPENTTCAIRHVTSDHRAYDNKPTKISGIMPSKPPPPPPPPAPPAPAGSQKNIIFLINDDQDQILGSMRAMPNTARLLGEGGANLTYFRVNTPICCPSRSTML